MGNFGLGGAHSMAKKPKGLLLSRRISCSIHRESHPPLPSSSRDGVFTEAQLSRDLLIRPGIYPQTSLAAIPPLKGWLGTMTSKQRFHSFTKFSITKPTDRDIGLHKLQRTKSSNKGWNKFTYEVKQSRMCRTTRNRNCRNFWKRDSLLTSQQS